MVGSELSDTVDTLSAFAAVFGGSGSLSLFLDVLNGEFGAGSFDNSLLVGGGVVAQSPSVGYSLHHLW